MRRSIGAGYLATRGLDGGAHLINKYLEEVDRLFPRDALVLSRDHALPRRRCKGRRRTYIPEIFGHLSDTGSYLVCGHRNA